MLEFVEIPIDEEMRTKATARAKKTIKSAKSLTSVFQTDRLTNHIIGFLGEEVFDKWLGNFDIDTHREIIYGKADNGDFLVQGKVIEIKTGHRMMSMSSLGENFKFLIPTKQKFWDIYVSVVINREATIGYITGYITKEEAIKYDVENYLHPCRAVPFKELKPVSHLLDEIKLDEVLNG